MQTKSFIVTAVCGFFKKLGTVYEKTAYHRFLCRLFGVFVSFFGKIFGFLFSVRGADQKTSDGLFSRVVNFPFSFLYRIFSKPVQTVTKKAEESFIVRIVSLVFENWHLISVKNYSTVLLAFTIVRLAVIRSVGRVNDRYTLVFLILSVIGMCIPASFAGVYQGSAIRKHLGLYDIKDSSNLIIVIKPHIATTCCLVAGSLLGVAILLPYWHIFVLCILSIIFIFTKPRLSALLITAVSLFVSQSVFFVMAAILAVVWLMQYFVRKTPQIHIDGLDVCIIFVIIAAICSALMSPVIKTGLKYLWPFFSFAMLYFILRKSFLHKNNLKMFIDIVIMVTGILAFLHLYKMTFTNAVFDKTVFYLLHSVEQNLLNSAVTEKAFGELYIVVIPLALCRMKMHHTSLGKIMYFVSAVLMGLCILFSYEQYTALLVLAIIMCVFSQFRRLASLAFVPLLAVTGVLVFNIIVGKTDFSVFKTQGLATLLTDKNFAVVTMYGSGLGKEALNAAYAFVFGKIPPFDGVMSIYASILFASGVSGIVIFIASIRKIFSCVGKSLKLSKEKNILANGILISAVLFVVTGIMPSVTYCNTKYMIFFTLAALAGAMRDITLQKEAQ